MKILHTSDLHIGKKLDGVCRLNEQKLVLDEIVDIAKENDVDVAIIAGDVFDTYIPSSDAENLFFETMDKFSEIGVTVVCVSGNHDDADRLTASKSLASKRSIYLCGGKNAFQPSDKGRAKLIDLGDDYLVLKTGNQEVFFATVPYFGEAPIGHVVDREKSFDERVGEILSEVFSHKKENQDGILVTHLFMLGGERSEGERCIDLGGVKVLSPSTIPKNCLYTALGHLHKRQVVSSAKNVIYSGSPLQYAYDEAGIEKSVTLFEIGNGCVENLQIVPLQNGRKLAKISCENIDMVDVKLSKFSDKFVDLTIFTDRPMTLDERARIKEKYPFITSLKVDMSSSINIENRVERRSLSESELFVDFYTRKFGNPPDEELMRAYLEIMAKE